MVTSETPVYLEDGMPALISAGCITIIMRFCLIFVDTSTRKNLLRAAHCRMSVYDVQDNTSAQMSGGKPEHSTGAPSLAGSHRRYMGNYATQIMSYDDLHGISNLCWCRVVIAMTRTIEWPK